MYERYHIVSSRLQELAGKLLRECSAQGLAIQIGETLRTVEEQDRLYAQDGQSRETL